MRVPLSLLVLILLFSILSCGRKGSKVTEIEFYTDFQKARADAARMSKPMIIDFYTGWCRWCDSLDANTYSDSLVISMSAGNIFVKIDAEADSAIAEEYAISGYPTIVIAKPDGEEIDRIWGYLPPTEFYNQVQLFLQGKETLEDYIARLEDEPENLAYLSMISEKYASRSNYDKAVEYNEKIIALDKDNADGFASAAMASIYDSQGRAKDYKSATKTCMRLLKEYPESEESDEAAALVGYYTANMGDTLEAKKLYMGYLKMNPDGENSGWVKNRLKDLEGE